MYSWAWNVRVFWSAARFPLILYPSDEISNNMMDVAPAVCVGLNKDHCVVSSVVKIGVLHSEFVLHFVYVESLRHRYESFSKGTTNLLTVEVKVELALGSMEAWSEKW